MQFAFSVFSLEIRSVTRDVEENVNYLVFYWLKAELFLCNQLKGFWGFSNFYEKEEFSFQIKLSRRTPSLEKKKTSVTVLEEQLQLTAESVSEYYFCFSA